MTPAEVCKVLDIQASTLRKYSLLLEKEGVRFERSKNNSRKYTETHVIALQETTRLMDSTDITLEKAIKQACKALKTQPIVENESTEIEPLQRHADDITGVLLEEIKSLKVEIRERDLLFVEALEKMQQKLDNMEQQQQQLIEQQPAEEKLETAESQSQEPPAKKKGFFGRLFK